MTAFNSKFLVRKVRPNWWGVFDNLGFRVRSYRTYNQAIVAASILANNQSDKLLM